MSRRCGQFVFVLLLCGCPRSRPPPDPDAGPVVLPDGGTATTRSQMVTAAADCATSRAKLFEQRTSALETATAALVATPTADTQAAARAAFHEASDTWQVIEALQYGPAAASSLLGGADVRDQINSWPLTSRCAIEETMVARTYENGVAALLVNRRGLPALEYLLFYEADDTACGPGSGIVAQGSWAALTHDERMARRRAYANAVAANVSSWAMNLAQQWETGFRETMVTAGPSNAVFKSTQSALNAVSDALFYVDKTSKDLKLARPLGLRECDTPPCLDLLESQYAARSKRNLVQNVAGLKSLALGCGTDFGGVGFDDVLIGVGADPVSAQLVTRVGAVDTALAGIAEPDLREALVAHPEQVRAVYDAAKSLTDLLKTDFLSVLDLELPKTVEGDND